MTGHIMMAGKDFGTLTATRSDHWTNEVSGRIQMLDLYDDVLLVKNHVEMKAVAVMVACGATSAQVVINHAPCGSEPNSMIGCEQHLPDFIPRGSALTVLGTDAQGQPFERIYHGKASQ